MDSVNWTKLITLVMVAAGTIILCASGHVSAEATVGTLSACLGYVFGNGHGLAEAQRYISKNINTIGPAVDTGIAPTDTNTIK